MPYKVLRPRMGWSGKVLKSDRTNVAELAEFYAKDPLTDVADYSPVPSVSQAGVGSSGEKERANTIAQRLTKLRKQEGQRLSQATIFIQQTLIKVMRL